MGITIAFRNTKSWVTILLVAAFCVFYSASASASTDTGTGEQQYYTINEDSPELVKIPKLREHIEMQDLPLNFFPQDTVKSIVAFAVNLLKWMIHDLAPPTPAEKYLRKLHFGRWINDPMDNTCMNTRARVLVRDSVAAVTYRGNSQCVIDSGEWHEPYAGKIATLAKEIQIDHMVPLKNAYISGAWQWDYKTRCLYSNYMGYKGHLVASDASQNMSKGDRAPDRYLPPNESHTCQYIKDWLAVKLIWKLNMTPSEADAIDQAVVNSGCDLGTFRFTQAELESQRSHINDNLEFCMINRR